MTRKKFFFMFLLLFLVVLIYYGRTLFTWFQQDEWDWIGRYTYYNSISKFPLWEAFKSSFFPHPRYRFTPLFDAFYAGLTSIFGLNYEGYAIASLLFHFVNSLLVFFVSKKLTKNYFISLLASILFAAGSIGQHAVTWTATSFNTLPAFTFSALSIWFLLDFLESKKNAGILKVYIFALIALWFKETALGLILAFPIIAYLKNRSNPKSNFKKIFLATFLFVFFYLAARIFLSRIGLQIHAEGYPDFGRLLDVKEYFWLFIWTPIRTLVDVFLFPDTLISLASKLVGKHNLFAENQGVDIITLLLFPIIAFLGKIVYAKIHKKNTILRESFLVAIVVAASGAISHLLLSVRGTESLLHIIRSRDLYIPTFGASLLIAIGLSFLLTAKEGYRKYLGLLILSSYFIYHFININFFILGQEISRREAREPIINEIYQKYPDLPEKVIFYTESDTPYYGSSTPGMPFQTGFGRTLLVWYTIKNDNIPKIFLKGDFLYPPFSQGYREAENQGFGYFSDFETLIEAVDKNNLTKESVYAFFYSGKNNLLTDITIATRSRIEKYEKAKK